MPIWLTDALQTLQESNPVRLAVPAVLFGILLVVRHGWRGLRLSDETLRSVIVTLVLVIGNGIVASLLLFEVDLTVAPWSTVGLPHLSPGVWLALPWPVGVVAAVFLIDVVDYWTHRLMHHSVLWGIHAVHHTDQRLTWMSAFRVHFLERPVMAVGYFVGLGWVGFPLSHLIAAAAIAYLHNRYVHCHLGWNHGPLAKVLASPNWHRWHHSVDPAAHNKNFANVFSCLDVVFGTYYNPGKCETEVGLGEPSPGPVGLFFYPFTYWLRTAGSTDRPTKASKQ